MVVASLPLLVLGLGPLAKVLPPPADMLPVLVAGLGPLAKVLPPPPLAIGALAEPLPLPVLAVGLDAELVGVSIAGAGAKAVPDAPGLDEDGSRAGAPVGAAPVAGVRGTTGDLPGVEPAGVDGTGTSLCMYEHASGHGSNHCGVCCV